MDYDRPWENENESKYNNRKEDSRRLCPKPPRRKNAHLNVMSSRREDLHACPPVDAAVT